MNPRVFVTGATGFIGSHIAQLFVESGFRVRCSLRSTSRGRWLEHLDVEIWRAELGDPSGFQAALRDVEIVVHAAGVTSARTKEHFGTVNTDGTVRLAEAAQCAGVRRFVYISSLAARGPDSVELAFQDRPISPYGLSKFRAEVALRSLVPDLEVVVLRPVTVYGPRDHDLLPLFRMAKVGFIVTPSRGNVVQLVNVSDMAAATVAAATAPAQFGPFPIAESATYAWPEVAEAFGKALSRTVRPVPLTGAIFIGAGWVSESIARLRGVEANFDVRRALDIAVHKWTCDPGRTRVELGWQANVPLIEGVTRTAEWYRMNGWL